MNKQEAIQYINGKLEEQALHINGSTPVVVVESHNLMIAGNLFYPSRLWVEGHPDEDTAFLEGLPDVTIYPSCKEHEEQWKAKKVGYVSDTYINHPIQLTPEVRGFTPSSFPLQK